MVSIVNFCNERFQLNLSLRLHNFSAVLKLNGNFILLGNNLDFKVFLFLF